MNIKRYNPEDYVDGEDFITPEMSEEIEGGWVKWEDIKWMVEFCEAFAKREEQIAKQSKEVESEEY